jgi:hypothetical protein
MKKVKQTNQNSPNQLIDIHTDRHQAMNLYEKGLLSAATLLEKMGYDPKQETDRRKNEKEVVSRCGGEVPNWSVLSNKIEQARRNAEMVAKVLGMQDLNFDDVVKKQLAETLSDSLNILKETSNIK